MLVLFFIFIFFIATIFIIRSRKKSNVLMVVLGSGGHTGEMFSLLQSFFPNLTKKTSETSQESLMKNIDYLLFVISSNDTLSLQRLSSIIIPYKYVQIIRTRDIHESLISALPKIISSLLQSFYLVFKIRPIILLTNGPGLCVPLIFASRIISPQTECVFVESICRTRTLSLTGKILYKLHLVKHFFVQWPRLSKLYPRTRYMGILV